MTAAPPARFARARAILGAPWFGPLVVSVSVSMVLISFLVLTGMTGVKASPLVTKLMMAFNGITALALLALVLREIWALRRARRIGIAASRLHERVVRFFGIVAAIPVVIVSIVAFMTIDRAYDSVITPDLTRAVNSSVKVAEFYFEEQKAYVRVEAIAMSNDIEQIYRGLPPQDPDGKPDNLKQILTAQAIMRGFITLVLMRSDGTQIERVDMRPAQEFMPPTREVIDDVAKSSDVVVNVSMRGDNYYREALFRTHPTHDRIIYAVRPLSRELMAHIQASQRGSLDLQAIADQRLAIQLTIAQTFMLVALLVLLSAVYLGIAFANRLVTPIKQLIGAASEVATGNLSAEVHIRRSEGDLAELGETFNTMTRELQSQRQALIMAADQIDFRRRFSEAVLAGVSAGVVGLDDDGAISIINPTACDILDLRSRDCIGRRLADLVPEFAGLLGEAGTLRPAQEQVTLLRRGKERTLALRITSERDETGGHGAVVTFDDVTELVTAQRTAAWADIARRIAHEIKNPLTPIQLSAERLRRRYGKVITVDREVFEQCTSTIIRQVGDIGRMVDEFSSFARMPRAQFESGDLGETVKEVAFLMRMGHPDIIVEARVPDHPVRAHFDRRLISQGLTNLIKNAAEAIAGAEDAATAPPGRIIVGLRAEGDELVIDVEDNGKGLPRENRQRLLEPYVTTREKGTGLGLAIVGRIIEDHGGRIELLDAPAAADGRQRGALIRLHLQRNPNGAGLESAPQHTVS